MARLIDADALLKSEIRRCGRIPTIGTGYINEKNFESILAESPTVDAVEVVHGRWIQSEPGYRLCSHCMADVAIYSGHRNYCPNCGAKMDGVQG